MTQAGHAIGVDLGTSHTVAVVRWPDGRTRPLLFDGQPILPSAVYLDEHGRLHVGRDAQRLAQLDPTRFEPNPKRRIDEFTVLLGDREGPVVGLLSAILRLVAAKATETCGLLPPAVLTYPAAWGAARRGLLQEAATQAGWPLARLLPEPIGAARYFADTLRHPLPDGGALAVFDFGGGTLDIAVVRRRGGTFEVIGSGGAEDLGGLDFDAALVNHLGGVLAARQPVVWRQLSAPATPTDRRLRRLFWEDVRGAKEMLSRATVAPVPIPGVDDALHVTREEFERLARPLATRAVEETAAVVDRCGLGAGQLSGVFLVGGASRTPLVAQMLHARLGFAPTALEQPELPVAEGALAELVAADAFQSPASHAAVAAGVAGAAGPGVAGAPVNSASAPVSPGQPSPVSPGAPTGPGAFPVSPGAPTSPGALPTSPGVPVTGHGAAPVSPAAGFPPGSHGPPTARPWWRRPWVYAAVAGVAVVALLGATLLYLLGDGEEPFASLTQVKTVDFQGTALPVQIQGDRAYLAAEEGKTLTLTAVRLPDGEVLWDERLSAESHWDERIAAYEKFVVAFEQHDDSSRTLHLFAPTGKRLMRQKLPYGAEYRVHRDRLVVSDENADTWTWIDVDTQAEVGRVDDTDLHLVDTWAAESGSAADLKGYRVESPQPDQRMVAINDLGSIRVLDASDGSVRGSGTLKVAASSDYLVRAYAGRLIVVGRAEDTKGYQVYAHDLAKPGASKQLHADSTADRTAERATPCGEQLLCLVDSDGHLVPVDLADGGALWRERIVDEPDDVGAVNAMGDRIMVAHNRKDTPHTSFFDHSGNQTSPVKGVAAPVDQTTALLFPAERAPISGETVRPTTSTYSVPLTGIGAVSGRKTEIGSVDASLATCAWNHAYIACAGESTFSVHRFREV